MKENARNPDLSVAAGVLESVMQSYTDYTLFELLVEVKSSTNLTTEKAGEYE